MSEDLAEKSVRSAKSSILGEKSSPPETSQDIASAIASFGAKSNASEIITSPGLNPQENSSDSLEIVLGTNDEEALEMRMSEFAKTDLFFRFWSRRFSSWIILRANSKNDFAHSRKNTVFYSPKEFLKIQDLSTENFRKIHEIKRIFEGTIVEPKKGAKMPTFQEKFVKHFGFDENDCGTMRMKGTGRWKQQPRKKT